MELGTQIAAFLKYNCTVTDSNHKPDIGLSQKVVNHMLGYKLYLFDKTEGAKLIAVLPERRKEPQRITEESVIKWGATLLGGRANRRDIFFERVTISDIREKILWVNPAAAL